MNDYLRIFEAKALAEELTRSGHSVSERTAQRWKAGETHPKPQDIRAIRELVGSTLPDAKKEPPEPAWVGRLEDRLKDIRQNQDRVAQLATQGVVSALSTPEMMAWQETIARTVAEWSTQSDEESADPLDTEAQDAEAPEGRELS